MKRGVRRLIAGYIALALAYRFYRLSITGLSLIVFLSFERFVWLSFIVYLSLYHLGVALFAGVGCFALGLASSGFSGSRFCPQQRATQQAFAADGTSEVFIEVGCATLGKPLGGVCVAAAEMRRWADTIAQT